MHSYGDRSNALTVEPFLTDIMWVGYLFDVTENLYGTVNRLHYMGIAMAPITPRSFDSRRGQTNPTF